MNYSCSNCPYCKKTADLWTCWCTYWNKVVRIGEGCTIDEE